MIENLTPKKIVAELNKYIIGQDDAKKAVSIALRNRWRRQNVPEDLQEEIMPKNILMVGPTGVGKTEIARRLSKLVNAPFIKVEATKFTEVGYVGRDVESIIRDLMEVAIQIEKSKHQESVKEVTKQKAVMKILDVLVGDTASYETRESFLQKILSGELDDNEIEVEVSDAKKNSAPFDLSAGAGIGVINVSDMLGKALSSGKKKKKKMKIKEALEALIADETEEMSDDDLITRNAINAVENEGIVFIDEIDKIAVRQMGSSGREVSREGVQRDLLPLLEGTIVVTKYGNIKTNHILFICSGAFHQAKPADLLAELQGRLPIRVELNPLSKKDLVRILTEPIASLPVQYTALLKTEKIALDFTEEGLKEIASIASRVNEKVENIGARRLYTIVEKILSDVSFEADSLVIKNIAIDKKFIKENTKNTDLEKLDDLSKFIL